MDNNDPDLGLSNTSLTVNGNNMQCSFTRDNINSNQYHLNLNNGTSTYFLAAYGQGGISNHQNNKQVTSSTYLFAYSSKNSASSMKSKQLMLLIVTSIVLAYFI